MPRRLPELGFDFLLQENEMFQLRTCCSEGTDSHEEEGNYLDMSDPPNYDDFMYLRSVDKGHIVLVYFSKEGFFLGLSKIKIPLPS